MAKEQCAKCKHHYDSGTIRKCPYSKKGAWVCVYCCKRCPHVTRIGTGFGCELWTKEEKCTIR